MPSHIFTRLGLWDESIASNLASAAAAPEWVARSHPGATAFDELHALDYLEYAYLQTCRDTLAAGVLDTVGRVQTVDEAQFAAAYALAAVPVRHALEGRAWSEAQVVTLRPTTFPWERFLNTQALVEFAHVLGFARAGAADKARAALDRLAALQKTMVEKKDAYWAGQAEIQRLAASAWIAQAEGRGPVAAAVLRQAADAEHATEKHPVTPGQVLPAREQLGDLLLEQGQPQEALAAYQASLKTAPGRYNSLLGAMRAATKAGDTAGARAHAAALRGLCAQADSARPGLDEARAVLAASR
jgi:tetratricopeptide (TPR) repeat protein